MPGPEPTAETPAGPPQEQPPIIFVNVPEFYADGQIFSATPFTVTLSFMVTPLGPGDTLRPVAIVRMSPEHAKVMAIALRKNMKAFEAQLGVTIALAPDALKQFNIDLAEDW